VVGLEPYDVPAGVHLEPCPEIHFPSDVPIPVHKNGEMLQVEIKQLDERISVSNHETAAKPPVDVVDDVFDALAALPATRIRNELGSPFTSCQEFHVGTCRRLLFKNMREVEIDPGKVLCVERVFVDGIHDEFDFHVHETKKQEGVLDHVSRGWQIVFIKTADLVCPRFGVVYVSEHNVIKGCPFLFIHLSNFLVDIQHDGYTSFRNVYKVVHAPLMRFVRFFAIDVYKA
jgi:hypothetical protein